MCLVDAQLEGRLLTWELLFTCSSWQLCVYYVVIMLLAAALIVVLVI